MSGFFMGDELPRKGSVINRATPSTIFKLTMNCLLPKYDFLKKISGTYAILVEMFTKIRDTGEAPGMWASSRITLIPKSEKDTNDPTQFRMIALTANVGKLYHTLESSRAMSSMTMNKYLDPSAQKAYIQGINGCVEHVQVVTEVI